MANEKISNSDFSSYPDPAIAYAASSQPPSYTEHEGSGSGSGSNPTTLMGKFGPAKVFSTYHIHLEQNYMRPLKIAKITHMDSSQATFVFEFSKSEEASMTMHKGDSVINPVCGKAAFGKAYGASDFTFPDGCVAELRVLESKASRAEGTRVFRINVKNSTSSELPNPMFWKIPSLKNWEFCDQSGKVYAVLHTTVHKSMHKMGRLHFLVEPNETLVELILGTLMCIWKKGERDFWRGKWGVWPGAPKEKAGVDEEDAGASSSNEQHFKDMEAQQFSKN